MIPQMPLGTDRRQELPESLIAKMASLDFAGRRRKGDRRGSAFVADDLKSAKKELGEWRAVDKALDGTPSFVRAEFWDREAWLMAAKVGKPERCW